MNADKQNQRLASVDTLLSEIREQLAVIDAESDYFALRALQLLLEVSKAMHTQPNVHSLVALILDSVLSFVDGDRAFLMLLDETGSPRFKMGRDKAGNYLTYEDFVVSTGVVNETLASAKPIILVDAQNDELYNKRQSVQDLSLRTIMAAPLRYAQGTIGLIYVDSQRPLSKVTPHHLNLLASLADQATVAIHNAQKFETHHG